jgi:hypothetical protein
MLFHVIDPLLFFDSLLTSWSSLFGISLFLRTVFG